MEPPVQIAVVAVLALLVLASTALLVRTRAESRRALAAAHAEADAVRARLEALEARLESSSAAVHRSTDAGDAETADAGTPGGTYLITDAGLERAEPTVADRVVLSATLGEPLVKAFAFGHGVRRALSAESRNRIWFEVRRETRRARKQRRRETREAWRRRQAEERAADQAA